MAKENTFSRIGYIGGNITLKANGLERTIAAGRIPPQATAGQLRALMATEFGGQVMREIFIHKNRNGRFAFAIYEEPAVWPEDFIDVSSIQR